MKILLLVVFIILAITSLTLSIVALLRSRSCSNEKYDNSTINIYSISNHTDNPQIVTIDTTDVSIPAHSQVALKSPNVTFKKDSDIQVFKLAGVPVNKATDISEIPSLYEKIPTDNTYQVTWEYKTDGHGQFEFPNPPTFSPFQPTTLSYWTNIDETNKTKPIKVGLGMLCGILSLSDSNFRNKYVVTYKKVPNTPFARKKIPWAALTNNTQNLIQWKFYNESADKTDQYPTHHLTTIDVEVGNSRMINMETGFTEIKETIFTASLLALGTLLGLGIPFAAATFVGTGVTAITVPESVVSIILEGIAPEATIPLMAEVGQIGGEVVVNGGVWENIIPIAVPVVPP